MIGVKVSGVRPWPGASRGHCLILNRRLMVAGAKKVRKPTASFAWPSLWGRPMTPLQLSDDEMSVLMTLAGPIDQRLRPQFLQEVAAELEAKRQAGEVDDGAVYRLAHAIQRKILGAAATWRKQVSARVKSRKVAAGRKGPGVEGDRCVETPTT
jgi:hypothetical protein